jgi:hypothetical protein
MFGTYETQKSSTLGRFVNLLGIILVCSQLAHAQSNEKIPTPEYYGLYAVADGKIIWSDESPSSSSQKMVEIRLGGGSAYSSVMKGATSAEINTARVLEFPGNVRFLVFTSLLAGEIAGKLTIQPLLYARKISVEVRWPNPSRNTGMENAWDSGVSAIGGITETNLTQPIKLRVKPAPGRADMALAVPSEELTPGVYKLSARSSGKFILFAVGPLAEAEGTKCVDVSYIVDNGFLAAMPKAQVQPCSGQGHPSDSRPSADQPDPSAPTSAPPSPPAAPGCSDYESCLRDAATALQGQRWNRSLSNFQRASSLQPAKPEAWKGQGDVLFSTGQYGEAAVMWQKSLGLGGVIAFRVCHERSFNCQPGTFSLSGGEISFTEANGQRLFAVAPSAVEVKGVYGSLSGSTHYFRLRVSGRNYNFDYYPPEGACEVKSFQVECLEPALTRQKFVANYITLAIPQLAK